MRYEKNWASNYTFQAAECLTPERLEEVQAIVAASRQLKVVGSRHSFNGIADTTATHLSLERMNRILALDRAQHRVTVEGGVRYGELCQYLHEQGYALHNLASLPHISVAGAVATATHGSGDAHGNLASAVYSLELVLASGELLTLTRDDAEEAFFGAVVGLGALGVVTKLTLGVVPTFEMAQHVYERLALSEAQANFEAIVSSGYSVSLFTSWAEAAIDQVWVKRIAPHPSSQTPLGDTFYGAQRSDVQLHPVPGHGAEHCSEQCGIVGPWHERLPHFKLAFTPSAGEELQSEYIVPREHAAAALEAIASLRMELAPLLYTSEIRTIAADRLWLSPCYGQDGVGFHFTWRPQWEAVRQMLPRIESLLAPFSARPHWAKLFTMSAAELQPLFPRLPDFRALARRCDPEGKFHNDYLQTYIFASS